MTKEYHSDTLQISKGGFVLAISKDNDRILTIVSKKTSQEISKLAEKEKRSISAMVAILIEKGLEFYHK